MEKLIPLIDPVRQYMTLIKGSGAILVICLATAVSMIGHGIITPVLPLFAKEFGVRTAAIGFVVATFGLSRLFMNLPSGMIAERYGIKRLMGIGLMVSALGLFFTGAAGSILEMAAWRFVSGAGSAMFVTGAVSFIAVMSTPQNRGRLMSLQIGSLLLGTDIGPIIGGFIADHLGFRWPFYIAGIISTVSAVGLLIKLREVHEADASSGDKQPQTGESGKKKRDMRTIRSLLSDPTFLILCIFTLFVFFTRSGSRQTLMPLLAVEKIGMSATQLGFLFFLMTTINLFLAVLAGALTDRFGRKAVILPGAFIAMMGLSCFAWTTTMPAFFGAAFLLGLGTGVIGPTPAAYAADMAPPGKTGTTMGLYRTFGDLGLVIGPLLLGWISDAFDLQFGSVIGKSVAMEFNAFLLLALALLLSWFGVETAGRRR